MARRKKACDKLTTDIRVPCTPAFKSQVEQIARERMSNSAAIAREALLDYVQRHGNMHPDGSGNAFPKKVK